MEKSELAGAGEGRVLPRMKCLTETVAESIDRPGPSFSPTSKALDSFARRPRADVKPAGFHTGDVRSNKKKSRLSWRLLGVKYYNCAFGYLRGTVATVCKIRLAIWYGSPWEFGRRSSK